MRSITISSLCALLLGACAGSGEYIAPYRDVGPGVPADMPALADGDFAVLRLAIFG